MGTIDIGILPLGVLSLCSFPESTQMWNTASFFHQRSQKPFEKLVDFIQNFGIIEIRRRNLPFQSANDFKFKSRYSYSENVHQPPIS